MVTRRSLLKAASLIPVSVAGGYFVIGRPYEELIEAAVRHKLHFLKINSEKLRQFSLDYAAEYGKGLGKIIGIDLGTRVNDLLPYSDKLAARVDYFESFVSEVFLRASDFFISGADESREINYIGLQFANPYKAPCFNPFAKFND